MLHVWNVYPHFGLIIDGKCSWIFLRPMWGASGMRAEQKCLSTTWRGREKGDVFLGFFRSQKMRKEGRYFLVGCVRNSKNLTWLWYWGHLPYMCRFDLLLKKAHLWVKSFTRPHYFKDLHTNLEPHGHPFVSGLAIHWMMISRKWLDYTKHPSSWKTVFFGGTGMKLNIHDDRQKQPQVATGNTTTFQQKNPLTGKKCSVSHQFVQHKSSRNHIKRKYKMGPIVISYKWSLKPYKTTSWTGNWGKFQLT